VILEDRLLVETLTNVLCIILRMICVYKYIFLIRKTVIPLYVMPRASHTLVTNVFCSVIYEEVLRQKKQFKPDMVSMVTNRVFYDVRTRA